jgi:ferredoxin/flavodoxin
MEVQTLKLVYFSPTGTTKSVVQGISRGINQYSVEIVDVTDPDTRTKPLQTSENELLVIAVPVYMGRVPALLLDWLQAINAQKTPVVCVAVYGNRAYDDALLELKNIMTKCGCKPIACAAYIGEHSFSSPEIPVAEGRPDAQDLHHAELFGRKIDEKLHSVFSVDQLSDVNVPGTHPYRGDSKLWIVDFIAVSDECTQCGVCAKGCPTGAIDPGNSVLIDTEKCITCCACIKSCPQKARAIKTGLVKDASIRLSTRYKERKEPEFFL